MKKFLPTLTVISCASLWLVPTVSALDITVDDRGTMRFYQGRVLGRDSQSQQGQGQTQQVAPQVSLLKTVPSYENKDLTIRAKNQGVETELQNKTQDGTMTQSEKIGDNQVKVQIQAKDQQQVKQKNQAALEIQSRQRDQKQVLELRSQNVRAELKQDTEFKLDPETQAVTVVTPSGQKHTLNHLPDRAVANMRAAGVVVGEEPTTEIETTDEGEVYYTTKTTQRKRLFGLFPRNIEAEARLNDVTGEVSLQELPAPTYFSQLLNNFSF